MALEAENNLPYRQLPAEARRVLDEGVICHMFEGHAPYKPRYAYPITPVFWRTVPNGWSWKARKIRPRTLSLTILYHHVPSVTSMPASLGNWMRCCNRMLEF
ncbi:glycyl radical enzyme domain-containing protein [Escherichia coli]